MNENLLIKYIEQDDHLPGYDLGLLGESFSGFNEVFKELFEISQIQGELVLRTTRISEGSIDVANLVQIVIEHSPFKEPKDLLDFLQVVSVTLHQQAENFFNAIGNGHKTVNDYFRENQFDNSVVTGLLVLYFPKMLKWAGKQAKKLQNMVSNGRYKKALKPLTENGISSVKVMTLSKDSFEVSIDETQLENYLPEEEAILPELENGNIVNLSGQILALQSTRGEKLKFEAEGINPRYKLLTAHPPDGKNTEDFMDYYKKIVNVRAQVYRKTLYKRPEIIILEIELGQGELFPEQ